MTAGIHKTGKAHLKPEQQGVLERLGLPTKEEAWARVQRQLGTDARCLRVRAA